MTAVVGYAIGAAIVGVQVWALVTAVLQRKCPHCGRRLRGAWRDEAARE